MNSWRRWRALSAAQRWLLVEAGILLLGAKVALPLVRIEPERGTPVDVDNETREAARAIARMVAIASARAPFRVTCLHRTLVLRRLLRARGVPCALRLGVRSWDGAFEAHAWVELAGVPLNDDEAHVARFCALVGPVASATMRPGEVHAPGGGRVAACGANERTRAT